MGQRDVRAPAGPASDQNIGSATPAPPDLFAFNAAYGLSRRNPALSASTVITRAQIAVFAAVPALCVAAAVAWPCGTCLALVTLSSIGFLGGIVFRGVLTVLGGRTAPAPFPTAGQALPRYTILVPLYREANVLPRLARSLLLLDYPQASKDIKIIVEDDDAETAALLRKYAGEGRSNSSASRLENSGRSRGPATTPCTLPAANSP